MEKKIPVLYSDKADCCGCFACAAVCAKDAISMNQDEEGFFYPIISSDLCISCYQCIKVCQSKKG